MVKTTKGNRKMLPRSWLPENNSRYQRCPSSAKWSLELQVSDIPNLLDQNTLILLLGFEEVQIYVYVLCSHLFFSLIQVGLHSFVFHHLYPSSESVKIFSAPLLLIDVLASGEYTQYLWNMERTWTVHTKLLKSQGSHYNFTCNIISSRQKRLV